MPPSESRAVRCARCVNQPADPNAPLGHHKRNPYADPSLPAVYDPCTACNGTGYVPSLILDAIRDAFPKRYDSIIAGLRWSYDHWSFDLCGMYVGVERDGYVHS